MANHRYTTGPALAVFDFDRTLVDCSSLQPFLCQLTTEPALARSALVAGLTAFPRWTRADVKARYVGSVLRGRSIDDVKQVGTRFARTLVADRLDAGMAGKLAEHRASGDRTMVLSASLDVYLRTFVGELGIDELLCTEVIADRGVCTGGLLNNGLHGRGKVDALRAWLADHGMEQARVTAYGNGWQDRALLRFARQTTGDGAPAR